MDLAGWIVRFGSRGHLRQGSYIKELDTRHFEMGGGVHSAATPAVQVRTSDGALTLTLGPALPKLTNYSSDISRINNASSAG